MRRSDYWRRDGVDDNDDNNDALPRFRSSRAPHARKSTRQSHVNQYYYERRSTAENMQRRSDLVGRCY